MCIEYMGAGRVEGHQVESYDRLLCQVAMLLLGVDLAVCQRNLVCLLHLLRIGYCACTEVMSIHSVQSKIALRNLTAQGYKRLTSQCRPRAGKISPTVGLAVSVTAAVLCTTAINLKATLRMTGHHTTCDLMKLTPNL